MPDEQKSTTAEIRSFYESIDSPTEVTIWSRTSSGYHYITNGHFVVRVTASEDWRRDPSVMRSVDLEAFFDKVPAAEFSKGLAVVQAKGVEVPELGDCDNCAGSGRCYCAACEQEHQCGHCDGEGQDTHWPPADPVRIHPDVPAVASRNLAAAVHFAPDICEMRYEPVGDLSAIWFVGKGFCAAVMPRRGSGRRWFWEMRP